MTEATQLNAAIVIAILLGIIMLIAAISIIKMGLKEGANCKIANTYWKLVKWSQLQQNDRVRIHFTSGPIQFDAFEEVDAPIKTVYLVKPGDQLGDKLSYFPINEVACTGLLIERLEA